MTRPLFRIDLRRLILWMCLFFAFLALANGLYAAYQVQRDVLLQNTLESNRVYAQKLAQVTESFIRTSQEMIAATALDVGLQSLDPTASQAELEQVTAVTDTFNSLIAVNEAGIIFASTPANIATVGHSLKTPEARQLLDVEQPTIISRPFLAPTGRWLIMIAHPTFKPDGSYGGFVAGTLYLHEGKALQNLLGHHYYKDGSNLYVVDQTGSLIYHPDKSRIGTMKRNIAVNALLQGEQGASRVLNADKVEQLAGFAPVSSTGWGIVVQRPAEAAVAHLNTLFWRTFLYSLPLFVLSLMAIWWLARLISQPLRQLADVAANLDNRAYFARIRLIKSWYYEALLIRKGLLKGFSSVGLHLRKLHREGATDPLTALTNRRGLDTALKDITEMDVQVAVVTFDIDRFKSVNDAHGHAVGDQVLVAVASIALAQARTQDIVARSGGEEFVVLLPETDAVSAERYAERLRASIEAQVHDVAGKITVSIGIAHYPEHANTLEKAMHLADRALYSAKVAGRNRVHMAEAAA